MNVSGTHQRIAPNIKQEPDTTTPLTPKSADDFSRARGASGHLRKRTHDGNPVKGSPSSVDDWEGGDDSRIGVKRACNECRQQKLRCDVVQEPFTACTRCKKCGLDCRIDSNFKRVGKRKKNAEMEKELVELRAHLAAARRSTDNVRNSGSPPQKYMSSNLDNYMGSHDAVTSLLDLKSGGATSYLRSPDPSGKPPRRLEDIVLENSVVDELFKIFFTSYHPYLPLNLQTKTAAETFDSCPLLFWTILTIASRRYKQKPTLLKSLTNATSRLLWATIGDVPQDYQVVKALCLLCTWQPPISSTSSDPTLMWSGLMMQIAKQIGLHRPTHIQDFSKISIQLREEELKDRVRTWAVCNVVAQRVATGYGQPPQTLYDWTLSMTDVKDPNLMISPEADVRLRIEKFCDKVTRSLYCNPADPEGLIDENGKGIVIGLLQREYSDLEGSLKRVPSHVNMAYLRAAGLHMRLSVFFDSGKSSTYRDDLTALWSAVIAFLEAMTDLKITKDEIFPFATNYLVQMIIAAGFAILKLMNGFFAALIDFEHGQILFKNAIAMIREISITTNDLPSRLAEVLAQFWSAGGISDRKTTDINSAPDSTLQLKVRCRMSMSLVFDSIWRWREEFQGNRRVNLDSAVNNPTDPSATARKPPPTMETNGLEMYNSNPNISLAPTLSGLSRSATPGMNDPFGDWTLNSNDVFDPMSWMLDGLMNLPNDYS